MKKLLYFSIFLILFSSTYSDNLEYSGEVNYFGNDINENQTELYTFKIKGKTYSNIFKVIKKNNTKYISILSFFKVIGFTNYKKYNNTITMYLGNNLEKKSIDFKKLSLDDYILIDNDYYISEKIFKYYFTNKLEWNEKQFTLNIIPSFDTPKEINLLLDSSERKINENNNKPELIYASNKKLIDAGNLRFNLRGNLNNNENTKKTDWNGFLEYQGQLLYGNFFAKYDLKENKIGDFDLTYYDILPNYELKIGSYGPNREKEISFKKNIGFFDENGKTFIIKETVPLGSRVELLFNGITIDVKQEENGQVIFSNNLIKDGRKFVLKIYLPNGTIEEKEIKVNEDYNQQNKGEFGYDLYIREDHLSNKIEKNLNIHYGITDSLTLGIGYEEIPESFSNRYIYSKQIKSEIIYSNNFYQNPYTITYNIEKSLNKHKDSNYDYSKKYSHNFMIDTDIKNLSINYRQNENGKYYDMKRERYLELEYKINNILSVTFDKDNIISRTGNNVNDYTYGFEINNSWKSLLVTYSLEHNKKGNLEHELDFYYTGFESIITKLTNKFDKSGNYESELKISNKAWSDFLDYSFAMKYSSRYQDIYTFDFTIKLDNWFEIGTSIEKNGRKEFFAGIDRVVNLKNPLINMNTIDSSIVKVIAFCDTNNNNILDIGEEKLENIEVTLGSQKVKTDKDGIAYIYGIPSYSEYDLEVNSLKPSFKTDYNRYKIKTKGSATIVAEIPVKPMVSLTGTIKTLNNDVLENMIVTILDKDNKIIETINPEYDGFFYVSNIFANNYILEITYKDTTIYRENMSLEYNSANNGDNKITIDLSNKEF